MGESPTSALPQLKGLAIEAVEWLPSGADSGLVRVRGRWIAPGAARPGLPELGLRAPGGTEHRFESLPDARFARDPASWRGSYLVPSALVASGPAALWVEWPGRVRSGLPPLEPGLADVPLPEPEPAEESPGGEVIDRAVLAERRARRAEASEQAQARVAAEALKAVEALELQSAELERRLAEAVAERDEASPRPAGGARAASVVWPERAQLEHDAERRAAALTGALESLARIRAQSRDWRLRLRTGEIAHAGDAVRLAVLEAERATLGGELRGTLKARTAELEAARQLAESRAAELAAAQAEVAAVREDLSAVRAEAEQRLADARAEAAEAEDRLREEAAEAERRARGELDAAREAAAEAERRARGELDAARDEAADAERRARGEIALLSEVREELRARLDAEGARAAALDAAQAAARGEAEARVAELHARIEGLEATLAATETRLHTAAAEAAAAESRLRVESVARAALEDELDRARAGHVAADRDRLEEDVAHLTASLEAERADHAAARDESSRLAAAVEAERAERAAAHDHTARLEAAIEAERAERAAARDEATRLAAAVEDARGEATRLAASLETARAARTDLAAELAAERERRAALEAELESARAGGAGLLERIAELDRTAAGLADEARLQRAAREQAEAAAAAARRPSEESGRMLADLDAAAAALREAAPATDDAPAEVVDEAPAKAEAAAPAVDEAETAVPAAAPPRPKPTIVSASGPPPRVDVTGRSAREYPPLRGAIVKLAHDDPESAAKLIAALLPAQAAALSDPLDYDITIKEAGTYSVTVAGTWTHVKPLDEPRPRGEADFHLTADAITLAELLAGIHRHVGRAFGPARFRGNGRRVRLLKTVAGADLTLSEVVRAGAALTPGLVYKALSYAIHPSWTKGERFTVAQQITGGETWYLSVRDGAGLAVSEQPPEEGVDATVTMSAEAFRLLLRGEQPPSGERPAIRGDRRAVARMKAWADRTQGV